MAHKEGHNVPYIQWKLRVDGSWETVDSDFWFKDKTVVVFSLPGAFTPTCSTQQLPGFEDRYQEFLDEGIDDVYCVSVNDAYVMHEWNKLHGHSDIDSVSDPLAKFAKSVEKDVDWGDSFGVRSHRYAFLIKNGVITKEFLDPLIEGVIKEL